MTSCPAIEVLTQIVLTIIMIEPILNVIVIFLQRQLTKLRANIITTQRYYTTSSRTAKYYIPRPCWVIYFETSRKNAHELSIVLVFAISARTHSSNSPGNFVSTLHVSSIVSQGKTDKQNPRLELKIKFLLNPWFWILQTNSVLIKNKMK